MRFVFKTRYEQDMHLFKHRQDIFWYGLLAVALILAPIFLSRFYVGELSFVFIYSIAGLGLMLLTGYTGQVSLGHAAFLAIGAYTHGYLLSEGWPFVAAPPYVDGLHRSRRRDSGNPCTAACRNLSCDSDACVFDHRGTDRHSLAVGNRR